MKIILLLLLFAVNVAWPHEQLPDNKVSFSYEKIDLKDLFEVLAHTGGVHFIGYKS